MPRFEFDVSDVLDERLSMALATHPLLREMADAGESFDALMEQILFAGIAVYEAEKASAAAVAPGAPRFANVSCSQCGQDFGPGNHGFSHCANHRAPVPPVPMDAPVRAPLRCWGSFEG